MLKHLNIRHKCPCCSKSYTYRQNLNVHVKSHMGGNFKCIYCDKSFARSDNLQMHIRKIHAEKIL